MPLRLDFAALTEGAEHLDLRINSLVLYVQAAIIFVAGSQEGVTLAALCRCRNELCTLFSLSLRCQHQLTALAHVCCQPLTAPAYKFCHWQRLACL